MSKREGGASSVGATTGQEVVLKNWDILGKTKTPGAILDVKTIFGRRRNKNLLDKCVHASTGSKPARVKQGCIAHRAKSWILIKATKCRNIANLLKN